jgi:hypothetical protein
MNVCTHIRCEGFPFSGVNHAAYVVPDVELDP